MPDVASVLKPTINGNVFKTYKPAAYGGIEFPFEEMTIECGIRHHVHEYPHQHGAALEKMGRHLYGVTTSIIFDANLIPERYRRLFPDNLNALREMWLQQVTDDLHVPHIGDIKMMCVKWRERITNRLTSGVKVEAEFLEDMNDAFGFQNLVQVSPRSMAEKTMLLGQLFADLPDKKIPLLSAIMSLADQVLAYKDQFDMYCNLVESKLLGLISLVKQADAQVKQLNDPDNLDLLDAFREFAAAVIQLHQDVMQIGLVRKTWITPKEMTVGDVSAALYGDSTRAADILKMNALTDPFAIRAGTSILYYQLVEQKAA